MKKPKLNRGQERFVKACSQVNENGPKTILAHIGVGGGKSALPTLGLKILREKQIVDKVCWVVPNTTLSQQAEESCQAPWLQSFNGGLQVRRSINDIDPSRNTDGFVTSYQALASDSAGICAFEFTRSRYLLCLDEVHKLTPGNSWAERLRSLVDLAHFKIYMTATLFRHDGRQIAYLPYRRIDNANH